MCKNWLALALILAIAPATWAQDVKETGKIAIGKHLVDLKLGMLYQFEVEGKGFQPDVFIDRQFKGGNFAGGTNKFSFIPSEAKKHIVIVLPNPFNLDKAEGPLDYTLRMQSIELGAPVLDEAGATTMNDPVVMNTQRRYREYKLNMIAGKTYVIDQFIDKTVANNSFDPYLYLQDGGGKILQSNDDGAGYPNARIVFTPTKTEEYSILASGLFGTGAFKLTVRGTK